MPNNICQFWQELRRRNVVRVITVYAGVAFVIPELAQYRLEKQPDSWGARVYIGVCLYELGR